MVTNGVPSLAICPTWKVACSSSEEWEELVESLQGSRKQESKRLYKYLNDELLPYVLQEISAKVSPVSHAGHKTSTLLVFITLSCIAFTI